MTSLYGALPRTPIAARSLATALATTTRLSWWPFSCFSVAARKRSHSFFAGALTAEEAVRYGWNYARLLSEGPSLNALVASPIMRAMSDGKIARIEDIGGPDTHSNFPLGWAMASNTPLRRYKQNTHGGGIRDPLVISWPKGLPARGELRHQFCHASDFAPTILDVMGLPVPRDMRGKVIKA